MCWFVAAWNPFPTVLWESISLILHPVFTLCEKCHLCGTPPETCLPILKQLEFVNTIHFISVTAVKVICSDLLITKLLCNQSDLSHMRHLLYLCMYVCMYVHMFEQHIKPNIIPKVFTCAAQSFLSL